MILVHALEQSHVVTWLEVKQADFAFDHVRIIGCELLVFVGWQLVSELLLKFGVRRLIVSVVLHRQFVILLLYFQLFRYSRDQRIHHGTALLFC